MIKDSKLTLAKNWIDEKATYLAVLVLALILVSEALGEYIQLPVGAYLAAIAFLILLTIDHVVKIERRQGRVRVFEGDRGEAINDLREYCESRKVKRFDAIEYSAVAIDDVFDGLLTRGCQIRLLLCDPRTTNDQIQRAKIKGSYLGKKASWERAGKKKKNNVAIGFYNDPATLRGRNFDDRYVSVGWFIFQQDEEEDGTKAIRVHGDDKVVINASTSTAEGGELLEMFKLHFDDVWKRKIEPKVIEDWWSAEN